MRTATERFKPFTYDELVEREKVSLDIIWLQDESLEDSDNLPAPEVIAAELVDELEAALTEFRAVAEMFGNGETLSMPSPRGFHAGTNSASLAAAVTHSPVSLSAGHSALPGPAAGKDLPLAEASVLLAG